MKKLLPFLLIGCGFPNTVITTDQACTIKMYDSYRITECPDMHTIYYLNDKFLDTLWVKPKPHINTLSKD